MIDFDTWLKDNTPREVAYNRADMERGWNGAMTVAAERNTQTLHLIRQELIRLRQVVDRIDKATR